jgi:hypothetical protein
MESTWDMTPDNAFKGRTRAMRAPLTWAFGIAAGAVAPCSEHTQ